MGCPVFYSDEQVLHMVRLRKAGLTSPQIAAQLGMTSAQVRVQTNRVKDADLAESGEDRRAVLGFYR